MCEDVWCSDTSVSDLGTSLLYSLGLVIKYLSFKWCVCLCVGYVRADVGSGGDQRCEIFWSWNCRLWRAALGGCRELNSRPLEEQQAHPLSPEPALPVVLFGFMIIESYPFWDPWLRGWDILFQQPITVFLPRDQQEVVGREKAAFLLELLS